MSDLKPSAHVVL